MSAYYIVLDLEMNPVAAKCRQACCNMERETIEIGAVKVDAATHKPIAEFSQVIKPQFNSHIEPRITRLTGIGTKQIRQARNFPEVFGEFVGWVGADADCVYCWSLADLDQLRQECAAHRMAFPETLPRWTDFQAEYPKYVSGCPNRQIGLGEAAMRMGVPMNSMQAHRALYDAQVTAELIRIGVTGEYQNLHWSYCKPQEQRSMTYSIADACGGKLSALLERLA